MTAKWTIRRISRPDAALRLFVFPHSGGSPGEYVRWADQLPEMDVAGIQLPGRGGRLSEQPLTSMDEVVAAVIENVHFATPFILLGHSLGGLVAYEVALALRDRKLPLPERLVVSAIPAPHHGQYRAPVHHLPDDELVAAVEAMYGGGFAMVADDPELLKLVLPGHRADFRVYETYQYRPRPPLDVPVQVFGGQDDAIAGERLADWNQHTTAGCELRMAPGGHFFLREDVGREMILDFLRAHASSSARR